MSTDEYQHWLKESGLIAVPADYMPTLELTDEIKNTSLEDLIIQNKGEYSKLEQWMLEEHIKKEIEKEKQRARQEGRIFTTEDEQFIRGLYYDLGFQRPISPFEIALYSEREIKHIPPTSNIAKLFYLEVKERFIYYNQIYYNRVQNEYNHSQEEERIKKAQEKWKELEYDN